MEKPDVDQLADEHARDSRKIRAGRNRKAWTTVRDQERQQDRNRAKRIAKHSRVRAQTEIERKRAVDNLAAVIRCMNSKTASPALRENARKTFEANVDRVVEETGCTRDEAITRVYSMTKES